MSAKFGFRHSSRSLWGCQPERRSLAAREGALTLLCLLMAGPVERSAHTGVRQFDAHSFQLTPAKPQRDCSLLFVSCFYQKYDLPPPPCRPGVTLKRRSQSHSTLKLTGMQLPPGDPGSNAEAVSGHASLRLLRYGNMKPCFGSGPHSRHLQWRSALSLAHWLGAASSHQVWDAFVRLYDSQGSLIVRIAQEIDTLSGTRKSVIVNPLLLSWDPI